MQRKKRLLIVGGGNLCLQILQILVPRDQFEFHVASRDPENVTRLSNLVRLAALQLDVQAHIQCWKMNLIESDIERNAETLARIRPDIILNCASLQSWRVITQLPRATFEALDQAQLGPWLPMHLAPAYALMRAVKHACPRSLVVNAAFPDAVNAVLYKVGMAPTVGIGNIANLVPATRSAIARLARCEPQEVKIKLVGQHYFTHYVPRRGLPPNASFDLTYWIGDKEYTGYFRTRDIFGCVCDTFRRLGGIDGQYLTAMSAVSVIEHLFSDTEAHLHAPGPDGLPGGYPVKVGMGRVLLGLPYGLKREVAIKLNEIGQQQDGIDIIHADGSVEFGREQMHVMETMLGYFTHEMKVQDAAAHACELGRKYQAFADKIRQQGASHVTQPSLFTRQVG
ncbi:hypothetical protein [Pseudomonas sp. SLFW]|uniref:hypothetical protein n=1 Tax=Pseudomonas sp. SLFW TaxID=2683259 RepID=UPI001411BC08|nr:hypothetical protein [Pseudomonas sp. SLFW]NBB07967.1 hypothetical protein [Pseudomonas sp. SLFW]